MRYLLLIGAQKSGTTYLHNLVAQDPNIAVHPKKEPKYFAKKMYGDLDYHSMFRLSDSSTVILDSSAAYLHVNGTADRVVSRLGRDAVIVAVIRNPVDRAVSAYLHSVKHGSDLRSAEDVFALDSVSPADIFLEENEKIQTAVRRGLICINVASNDAYFDPVFHYRYITNSLYRTQLDPYFERFETVVVLDFDDLIRNPGRIADIARTSVGLTGPLSYNLRVSSNTTKLKRWSAVRQSQSFGEARAPLVRAAWRLFTQRYDKRYVEQVSHGIWAPPAFDDYQELIRQHGTTPLAI